MNFYQSLSAVVFVALTACGTTPQDSTVVSTPAAARHASPVLSASLTVLALDPQLSVSNNARASVEIDRAHKTVTVQLNTCPVGAMCIWAGPSYRADLVSTTTDACGAVVYTAKTDDRPVDGSLTEITVVDYSKLRCRIYRAYKTEVELKTSYFDRLHATEVTTKSSLKGKSVLQ